ncbi:hypothetical protein [Litoreibacter roseus]|uniref:Oxidoreductase n=1 Tax=Litoreibacter roseus TaxID=2601869 RepID=A0A6N6JGG3_9RHOB|nr:hypothetical protein [Litoreibacter roseus]GFE64378.1 oxidoreductase [Litoreibacter roseus]
MSGLSDFEPFSVAEQRLIDEAEGENRTSIGDGDLPQSAQDDRIVRADLIRFILLDHCNDIRLHDKGIRLRGAWISGSLDLQGCDCSRDISFSNCKLAGPLNLVNAKVRGLYLSGCTATDISADNTSFAGSVFIRSGSYVAGEISLAGARVSGDLQICDATLVSSGQDAIFAPSLRVEGSVFLGNYPYSDTVTTLTAQGLLFFSSARIDHDFFVSNTAITLPDEVIGTPIFGATEEHGRDMALSLARARIGGILYLQDNQITKGIVNLAGAEVARLKDEPEGPGAAYPIRLDGFKYGDFSRHADTNIRSRLDWLARRPADMPFVAQPYEQLANVLITLGHRDDARMVLMTKETLLQAESRRMLAVRGVSPLWRGIAWLVDALLRWTIGYGYRPGRSLVVAIALIVALGLFFQKTWNAGDMAPNSAPILVSQGWIEATETYPQNPGAYWASPGQAGQDWETFNSFAYAADLVIPLVSLGQENAWSPSTSRSPLGQIGWWLRWVAMAIGWIVTALGAAAITGVIRKD